MNAAVLCKSSIKVMLFKLYPGKVNLKEYIITGDTMSIS